MRKNARASARRDQWQTPRKHVGPISEDPIWLDRLVAYTPLGCAAIAAFIVGMLAYMWSADLWAGHL